MMTQPERCCDEYGIDDHDSTEHDQPGRVSADCLRGQCANCWNDQCACPYCGHPGVGKQAV